MGRISEVTDLVLDDIIEFLKNTNFGGEYDCATENYRELFAKYNIDPGIDCIADVDSYTPVGSMKSITTDVTVKADFEDFIQEYYRAVIESVCNAIATFKEGKNE